MIVILYALYALYALTTTQYTLTTPQSPLPSPFIRLTSRLSTLRLLASLHPLIHLPFIPLATSHLFHYQSNIFPHPSPPPFSFLIPLHTIYTFIFPFLISNRFTPLPLHSSLLFSASAFTPTVLHLPFLPLPSVISLTSGAAESSVGFHYLLLSPVAAAGPKGQLGI